VFKKVVLLMGSGWCSRESYCRLGYEWWCS